MIIFIIFAFSIDKVSFLIYNNIYDNEFHYL